MFKLWISLLFVVVATSQAMHIAKMANYCHQLPGINGITENVTQCSMQCTPYTFDNTSTQFCSLDPADACGIQPGDCKHLDQLESLEVFDFIHDADQHWFEDHRREICKVSASVASVPVQNRDSCISCGNYRSKVEVNKTFVDWVKCDGLDKIADPAGDKVALVLETYVKLFHLNESETEELARVQLVYLPNFENATLTSVQSEVDLDYVFDMGFKNIFLTFL